MWETTHTPWYQTLKVIFPQTRGILTPFPSHVLQVNSYIYSGSTGHQIGHRGSLGVDGTSGSLLYVTRAGAHYILLPCGMLCLLGPRMASLAEALLVSDEICSCREAPRLLLSSRIQSNH